MSKHKPRLSNLGSFGNLVRSDAKADLSERSGLVYCRVSSVGQKTEGTSLQTQESECRGELLKKGITFERSFKDSYTGGGDYMNRPAMRELFTYIDSHKFKKFCVIFYDLKRLARDTENHIKLRTAFKARDVEILCLNHNFDDSPEGNFQEILMAAFGELERKQNARQVVQKQCARLLNGYRAFPPVKGYKRIPNTFHGKIDIPNEFAPFVKYALEGFASLKYTHKVDAVKYLQKNGVISSKQSTDKGIATFDKMLKEVFYAGFIEYEPWEVTRRKGHHEPLISLETFDKNQKRLNDKVISYVRKDINDEFELRGLVNCSCCGQKLTAAFSKGKSGIKYPYYKCATKKCDFYGKSIQRDQVHLQFEEIIQNIKPCVEIMELAQAIFEDVWNDTMKNISKVKDSSLIEKNELQAKLDNLTTQISKTKNDTVIRQYERQIEKIGSELENLEAKLETEYDYSIPCRTSLEQVFNVLQNPHVAWKNYDVYQKQKFYSFMFEENLRFDKYKGYRTPLYARPLRLFEELSTTNSNEVEMGGVSPTKSNNSIRCCYYKVSSLYPSLSHYCPI